MPKSAAVILAAGKGTRMHSDRPKVLRRVLGEPMLAYVRKALRSVFDDAVWMVVGHQARMVQAAFPEDRFVFQAEQLGTGHALSQALPAVMAAGYDRVFVVNGDVPLLTEDILRNFLDKVGNADMAFATVELDDPGAYGRVVRENGQLRAIVEKKDYDAARYGVESHEVNAGMYIFSLPVAQRLLPRLTNENKSGEYYITDMIALGLAENCTVLGVECGRDDALLGVNTPGELAQVEELLRARTVGRLLESGVIIHAPESVRVSPLVAVKPGAELCGPCEISGCTLIARDAQVSSHCVVRDCVIGVGAEVRPFSHLEGARVGAGALVGPFARLRPGAALEDASHVGNFVEVKNALLGKGAKANHLTYLGDASVGAGANIGAGTITCNYDGRHKYKTTIGERAFIGSNTALVAPVSVGDNALVGAGSVITKDVPEGELAVARGKQKNITRKKK
jgi:bifunctional UDP-N-acetylglucosamine pyrophosphorylase/glucosamine-1-phosphate N-acetyltransferase